MSATMVFLNLLGGIVLLLWGIRMVRNSVQRSFGNSLRKFMAEWLSNRFAAFAAGMGVTTILQSSTATCLMVTDFAARNIVVLPVALAIMLGADVGTSVVAQLFSLDLSWLAPVLLLAGFFIYRIGKNTKKAHIGKILIGLSFVLMALQNIVAASEPLRQSEGIVVVISALEGEAIIAILLAAFLTWAAHSSLAIVLLVATLAGGGTIPVQLALVMILGANLGGALPPIIATYSGPVDGRRVAFGNGLFKLIGVVFLLPFVAIVENYLMDFDSNPTRLVVNFHMLFNLGIAVFFIMLTKPFSDLMTRTIPDHAGEQEDATVSILTGNIPVDPSVGLMNAKREVLRMGDVLDGMLSQSFDLFKHRDSSRVPEISDGDDQVDDIYEAVKHYLTEIRKEELDEDESQQCGDIMAFCANLEHVGDIIDKNLLPTAAKFLRRDLHFSDTGLIELESFHARVHENLRLALGVFMTSDIAMARRLLVEKDALRELEYEASQNHMERFQEGQIETLETSGYHLDIIRDLKRINSHLSSAAYPILDQAGELRRSRLRKKYFKTVESRA